MQHHLIEYIFTLLGSEGTIEPERQDPNAPTYPDGLAKDVKDFLDEIPGGFLIYYAHTDEKIIYANRSLWELTGCSSFAEFMEHTGGSFMGFVHPNDLDATERSIVEQISNSVENLDYVEYRVPRKDGTVRWVEDFGHFIHNDVLGDIFYVFITDATEKFARIEDAKKSLLSQNEQKEQELTELKKLIDAERQSAKIEQLRRMEVINALSISYESIFYVDLSALKIIPYRLNERTAALFNGLEPRDYKSFLVEYIQGWVHPDDRKSVTAALSPYNIKRKLAVGKTYDRNYRCLLSDGKLIHKQARVVNVSEDCTQIVIGLRNIDEELYRELQQKQILENALEDARRSAEAKDLFLSHMSHDMRTPLNAIFGFTNLAKNNAGDPDAVRSYLSKIEEAGEHMLDLTDRVLQMTYAESAAMQLNESDCNVCDVVASVYAQLQKKADAKLINFTYDCSGVKDPDVITDGEKLRDILYQLADNAIKYSGKGGCAEIRAEESSTLPNGYTQYVFSVRDAGIGISKRKLDTIFEPFEREHDSTEIGEFGTGLGLTIAKKLTEMLDGKIEVKSSVNKGSTFTVRIGFRKQQKQRAEVNMQRILDDIKSRRILIVEDNDINRDIEMEIMEGLGFTTDCAENGKVAVDMLAASPEDYYAVIIMDIQMPVMDGRQAAEHIRKMENPVLSNIPIIALSANAFESDKRLSAKAGIDAHLTKPLDVDELLNAMANIVYTRQNK